MRRDDPTQVVAPHDPDAERAVLGACLVSEDASTRVLSLLEGHEFYSEIHRIIFRGVRAAARDGVAGDHLAVIEALRADGEFEKIGGRPYVFRIVESVPTAANATRYAEIIKEHAFRRRLMDLGARVMDEASRGEGSDPVSAVEELHRYTTDTAEGDGVQTFAASHEDYVERVMLRKAGEKTMGIPTGLGALDRATTGFHGGDLIVLGARPSMAKSLFVWQSAITAARHGHHAFVMNLEMAFSRIQERSACATSGVSYEDWRRGNINAVDAEKLMGAHKALSELPISVHNPRAGRTVEDLRRALKALRPEIAFVDYLQLLRTKNASGADRYASVSLISNDLKQIALELSIPIIAVSQLSRGVEDRFDKRPVMADLRESGYIEQDADVVLMMYRDAYYYPEGVRDGKNGPEAVPNFHPQKVEFIARKDREGGNWTVPAFFEGERMWLAEHPYEGRQHEEVS